MSTQMFLCSFYVLFYLYVGPLLEIPVFIAFSVYVLLKFLFYFSMFAIFASIFYGIAPCNSGFERAIGIKFIIITIIIINTVLLLLSLYMCHVTTESLKGLATVTKGGEA